MSEPWILDIPQYIRLRPGLWVPYHNRRLYLIARAWVFSVVHLN